MDSLMRATFPRQPWWRRLLLRRWRPTRADLEAKDETAFDMLLITANDMQLAGVEPSSCDWADWSYASREAWLLVRDQRNAAEAQWRLVETIDPAAAVAQRFGDADPEFVVDMALGRLI
ncbi:MAG: hypothetical protein ACPGVG_06135 [Mycobacterium sp.]